jgi:Papain family cysteine protease
VRGLGFLPDPTDIVDAETIARPLRALTGSSISTLPDAFSWLHTGNVPQPRDQSVTSSCVGQALAASVQIRAAISGHSVVPSASALYAIGRLVENPRMPLVDVGSSPGRVIEGAKEWGMASEERWPFSVGAIDIAPPLDVFRASLDATLGQHYRIPSGWGAPEAIKRALVAGYIPIFAMTVDEAYDRYDGSDVYRAPSGRVLGRHMQCIVGYDGSDFEVLNSWGTGWGRDGIARIGSSVMASSDVSSIIVPTVVPGQVY